MVITAYRFVQKYDVQGAAYLMPQVEKEEETEKVRDRTYERLKIL